jgi:predicted transposase YbfD/YdcC
MSAKPSTIEQYFGDLPDPRRGPALLHPLIDLVTIALLAVICGADDWVAVQDFGQRRETWLSTFLALPHGIASHDTFRRVFALLSPPAFEERFVRWVKDIARLGSGAVIAIDGKTLRGSHDGGDGQAALVMISAYASEAGLVLAQRAVPEDTNEIGEMPALLKLLWLQDCVVTADAAHCQTQHARIIVEQGGDYVLALKDNQGRLYEQVRQTFETLHLQPPHRLTFETVEQGHGRVDHRHYTVVNASDYIDYFNLDERWWHLQSVIRVARTQRIGQIPSIHYFLSSLSGDAELLARCIRSHWAIENGEHWILDVVFRQDQHRLRTGFGPENFAILQHIALNLLKRETSLKRSLKGKRFAAALDQTYLSKVLLAGLP